MTSVRERLREITKANVAFTIPITVASVTRISDGFLRMAVTSEEFRQYDKPMPADAFKLMLPPAGHDRFDVPLRGEDLIPYWPEGSIRPMLRAATVRTYDPDEQRMEIDVADHAAGLLIEWVRSNPVGRTVMLSGMRREFVAGEGVDHQVLIGDATALPAVAAILESLDRAPVTTYLAVTNASDRALLPSIGTVHWVTDLAADVTAATPPPGRVQVWIAAEAAQVRDVRRHVLQSWAVHRDDLRFSAYWKAGFDASQFDAANLVRYQEAAAAKRDILDPDVREEIELALASTP
jgi:NADPH-dependent ferric siderophore reductase